MNQTKRKKSPAGGGDGEGVCRPKKSKCEPLSKEADDETEDEEVAESAYSYYTLLGVDRAATSGQIKKAYRKQALAVHPDHNSSADASAQFIRLTTAYKVLSDEKKRKRYDVTGTHEETSDDFENAYEYWRSVFPKITPVQIREYAKVYVGSEDERDDIVRWVGVLKGDMLRVMDCIPYAEPESAARIVAVVEAEISAGRINDPAVVDEVRTSAAKLKKNLKKQERWRAQEALEAEKHARDLGLVTEVTSAAQDDDIGKDGVPAGLAAAIRQRQVVRVQKGSSFLDMLASKYGGSKKKNKTKGKKTRKPPAAGENNSTSANKRSSDKGRKSTSKAAGSGK